MTNKQKFVLVDQDGSESQISPYISTKLVTLSNRKHFHACCNCHKIYCNPFLYTNHLKQCLSSTSTDFTDDVKYSTIAKLPQKPQFKCLKCKTLFPAEEVLLTHYKSCLIYNCVECNKQFASDGTLKIHFLTKHCEGKQNLLRKHDFTCESCSKEYLESLESIYSYYPKYKKIMCNDCKLSIPSWDKHLLPVKVTCAPDLKLSADNLSSDSDTSIAGGLPEPESESESEPEPVPRRGKRRRVSKKVVSKKTVDRSPKVKAVDRSAKVKAADRSPKVKAVDRSPKVKTVDLSPIQKNATPTSNALLQHESKIDELFKVVPLKDFSTGKCCQVCETKCRNVKLLKSHYNKSHSLNTVLTCPLTQACSYCKSKSSSFEAIVRHLYDKHSPRKCKHCDLLFCTVQERVNHAEACHPGVCRYCAIIFHSKEQKEIHLSWHLSEEEVKCETCDKEFKGIRKLKLHQVQHKEKLNNTKGLCVHCGKVANNLSRHIIRAHQKKLCLTCGKLLSESAYQYHRNVLHKNFKDTSVQCAICGDTQKSYKHYHYHRRMVHEQHLFVDCPTCPRKFPFPSYLKKHTETCRGKKRIKLKASNGPNKCEVCGESFSTENNLMIHLRKQHGKVVRRFACRHCPDMFFRNDTRIAHERIHTGERPFSCSVCGQRFRQMPDCKRHEDRHSGATVPRPKRVKKNPQATRVLEEVSQDLGYYVEYDPN